jgi:hypothetical protein
VAYLREMEMLNRTLPVYRNEHGEFAMQVVKDAKGMTFSPSTVVSYSDAVVR